MRDEEKWGDDRKSLVLPPPPHPLVSLSEDVQRKNPWHSVLDSSPWIKSVFCQNAKKRRKKIWVCIFIYISKIYSPLPFFLQFHCSNSIYHLFQNIFRHISSLPAVTSTHPSVSHPPSCGSSLIARHSILNSLPPVSPSDYASLVRLWQDPGPRPSAASPSLSVARCCRSPMNETFQSGGGSLGFGSRTHTLRFHLSFCARRVTWLGFTLCLASSREAVDRITFPALLTARSNRTLNNSLISWGNFPHFSSMFLSPASSQTRVGMEGWMLLFLQDLAQCDLKRQRVKRIHYSSLLSVYPAK